MFKKISQHCFCRQFTLPSAYIEVFCLRFIKFNYSFQTVSSGVRYTRSEAAVRKIRYIIPKFLVFLSLSRFGRTFNLKDGCPIEDYVVFYIGKESLTLTNHIMTYNRCQVRMSISSNVIGLEIHWCQQLLKVRFYFIVLFVWSRNISLSERNT